MLGVPFEFQLSSQLYALYSEKAKLREAVERVGDLFLTSAEYKAIKSRTNHTSILESPYSAFMHLTEKEIIVAITNLESKLLNRQMVVLNGFPEPKDLSPNEALYYLGWTMNGGIYYEDATHFADNSMVFSLDKRILECDIGSDLFLERATKTINDMLVYETERISSIEAKHGGGMSIFGAASSIEEGYVFVVMPFDSEFNDVYNMAIKPVLESGGLGLRVGRADEIYSPGAIMSQIWSSITRAKFLVADVSNKNPNVMYELGMAHALGKDVIMITQNINDIPFDLKHLRHIKYGLSPSEFEELKATLKRMAASLTDPSLNLNA
jgi:hypothetical protein